MLDVSTRVEGSGSRVSEFSVEGLGWRVCEFHIWGLRANVEGLGSGMYGRQHVLRPMLDGSTRVQGPITRQVPQHRCRPPPRSGFRVHASVFRGSRSRYLVIIHVVVLLLVLALRTLLQHL
eukprot:2380825-Rhodomonas_salina.2